LPVKIVGINSTNNNSLVERFERKYYILPKDIGLAYGLLRQICLPSQEYHSEQINSLYFDTPYLDQHERSISGDYAKDKVRIRWYGETDHLEGIQNVFLELKSRRGFSSTKQRCHLHIPVGSLSSNNIRKGIVSQKLLVDTLMRFDYFPSDMLVPIVQISYWRYRFNEITTDQRITLDIRVHSRIMNPVFYQGLKKLELPGAIIEIKGREMELPVALRKMKLLNTDWSRYSKYSACLEAYNDRPGAVGYLSPSGRIL
jgi:hypothetical protein